MWESRTLPGFFYESPRLAGSFFCARVIGVRGSAGPRYPALERMKGHAVWLRYWRLGAAALAALVALGIGLGVGPAVRGLVVAAAARRHVAVEIASVRPAWFGVRLSGVVAHLEGVPGAVIEVRSARIGLSGGLYLEDIEVKGVTVTLTGPEASLREQLAAWRALSGKRSGAPQRSPRVEVDGLSLRWDDGQSPDARAEVHGLDAASGATGLRMTVAGVRGRLGPAVLDLTGGTAETDASGALVRARAASLRVERSASVAPPQSADAGTHGAFPDLRAFHAAVATFAAMVSERVAVGADIGVDALTWKATKPDDQIAFTIGPGPLSGVRSTSGLLLAFSTDPAAASTPLAVRLTLPLDGADVALTLGGGPVALSLLGIREGAAGLVNVATTTASGHARVVVSGDGSAVTFELEGGARGLSISNTKLAPEVVRGLDLRVRASGALTSPGDLRLDELAATSGAIHLLVSGVIDNRPDHLAAALHFELPGTSCQSLLESVPTALLPTLRGTQIAGKFAARGRFAFDTRFLDDLELDYDIQDQCRVVEVPPDLARERFGQPFTHRIYLPDGSVVDATTGPGTPAWTPLDQVSPYMQVAVLTTEDGAFPRHHGYSRASIRASIIANIKARRFVRGASTITMQLAKNLFLPRDKTLSRKLEEVVLTDYLEQTFAKDELMELYLNVIEFGPGIYGITDAAEYYFGRTPGELNLAECMFLASVLPAPLRYGAMRDKADLPENPVKTLHALMRIAQKTGRITEAELAEGEGEPVLFWHGDERPAPRRPVRARPRIDAATDDATTAPTLDEPDP